MTYQVNKTDDEWKVVLTPQEFHILIRVAPSTSLCTGGDHQAETIVLAQCLRVHAGTLSCYRDDEEALFTFAHTAPAHPARGSNPELCSACA